MDSETGRCWNCGQMWPYKRMVYFVHTENKHLVCQPCGTELNKRELEKQSGFPRNIMLSDN